jgi:hypothetical protein
VNFVAGKSIGYQEDLLYGARAKLKGIERGEWKDLWELSVMSEKKTDSSFCWEATIKPDQALHPWHK